MNSLSYIFSFLLLMSFFIFESVSLSDNSLQFGPWNKFDTMVIDETINEIINVFKAKKDANNQTIINSLKFLVNDGNDELVNDHKDGLLCRSCLWTFGKFHNLLEKHYGLTILTTFASVICSTFLEFKICRQAVNLYTPTVLDALIEHYLDAEYICTWTHVCKYRHYVELNADDYARELLKDKPAFDKPVNVTVFESNSTYAAGKPVKFLHVSDIHTDLHYEEVY